MADGRLAIGAFSRASGLSVKMLRSYHELGILVPDEVDPGSGYRYYRVDQLADALIVVRLRGLHVPLAEVRRILAARDPELTRTVLGEHRLAMEQRLADTERIVEALQLGLAATVNTPVHVRTYDASPALSAAADVAPSELWAWLRRVHRLLRDLVSEAGSAPTGPPGARYRTEVDDEVERVEAFLPAPHPLPIPASAVGVANVELPATTAAVLVHLGDFDTIGDTYRLLGAWVGRNATPVGRFVLERFLTLDQPAAEAHTEICWPIEPVREGAGTQGPTASGRAAGPGGPTRGRSRRR